MKSFRNRTFRAVVASFTLVTTTFVHSITPTPQPKAVIIPSEHPMYLGTINGGIKGNDAYVDGSFSIVAPLWSTMGAEGTLSGCSLFLEPYISWGEGGEVATSLGLGYRYLFGSQSMDALLRHDGHQAGFLEEGVAVSANLFIDMLDTEAGNQFWQLGFGLEVQTRYLELRGNYYLPLTERQLAEETRRRQTFSSSSSSTSMSQTGSGVGDPYAAGNTIAQDINYSTLATTTTRTTTTTIEQLFRRYEEGMEGWDAEAAVLVPYLDRWFDLKLIAGYYSFDNQPFGPQQGGTGNVEGWKAGVEVRPVPAVILNGTWYEDDRLTGGDWTVGLQLQFPFEGGDLGDGKDFWDRIGDSFKPRRRHLIERVAEPARRQNAAIKLANSFDEDTRVVSQKSSVKKVTKVVAQSNQRVVLMDDVVFVNNGAPTGMASRQAASAAPARRSSRSILFRRAPPSQARTAPLPPGSGMCTARAAWSTPRMFWRRRAASTSSAAAGSSRAKAGRASARGMSPPWTEDSTRLTSPASGLQATSSPEVEGRASAPGTSTGCCWMKSPFRAILQKVSAFLV